MPTEIPDTPQTREETYLAAANGQEVELPDPLTREEAYLYEIATKMQGGGGGATVEPLSVTENGTYTAPTGKAYSPVTVNIGGIILTKRTGSYTPATDQQNLIITGLPEPPYALTFCVDTEAHALDGVQKTWGGCYFNGAYVCYPTNNAGTGLGSVSAAGITPTDLINGRTVYDDGTANTIHTGRIIVTKTGFDARRASGGGYPFLAGYTYNWVAYTLPEVQS